MVTPPRVLIIDGDRRIVDKLQELFVRSGCEAEIALSPSVAIAVVSERYMSVAVLNAELDKESDWQVVRHLKQSDPTLPVVVFNAPRAKGLSREARRLGIARLLGSPTKIESVLSEALKVMRN